jgi:nucleoside-diphosphate-sugar epimerase
VKYLVTGGTGFIGGELARQLLDEGHEVSLLARDPSRVPAVLRSRVAIREGDIRDRACLAPALHGVDGVFHCAAWYKIGDRSRTAWTINVDGTRNVCDAMREAGVPRGVYVSTVFVNGDTNGVMVNEGYQRQAPFVTEYERTKWVAHHEVAVPAIAAGLPLVIVLPGGVYGPGDTSGFRTALLQYLKGELAATPQRTAFCFSHVEDTARGFRLAMAHGRVGEAYHLAGPMHTFRDVFDMAEVITGVGAPTRHPRPATMRMAAAAMSIVERVLPVPSGFSSETLRMMAGRTWIASSAKAETELGWHARPMLEGLKQTLDYELSLERGDPLWKT